MKSVLAYIGDKIKKGEVYIRVDAIKELMLESFENEDYDKLAKATKKPSHFGEKVDLSTSTIVKPYNESFICPICLEIVKQPVISLCCE
jgi:hypothetical protein